MKKYFLMITCCLGLFVQTVFATFPALEYSVPFDLGGYTYTDYVILKIENSSAYDYAVVYYANHQSAYSTSECNKDLNCTQSACYGAFGYASYPDNRGTSGYLLQYNDWCGYIPHFSRKHNKTTGVWSDSGFENQNETLRSDPSVSLSSGAITTFPLFIFNYHPANDDFLGDYSLGVVTFSSVVLTPNVPTFRNAVGSFYQSSDTYGDGECVTYVLYETGITRTPGVPFSGNASTYYQEAIDVGYQVGSVPRVGSIVVFAVDTSKNMPYGHVGIVTAIDGSTITMQDQNWVNPGHVIGSHTVNTGNYNILGYIYYTP